VVEWIGCGDQHALLAWHPTTPLKGRLARTIAYFDRLLSEPGGGAGSIVPFAA